MCRYLFTSKSVVKWKLCDTRNRAYLNSIDKTFRSDNLWCLTIFNFSKPTALAISKTQVIMFVTDPKYPSSITKPLLKLFGCIFVSIWCKKDVNILSIFFFLSVASQRGDQISPLPPPPLLPLAVLLWCFSYPPKYPIYHLVIHSRYARTS